MVGAMFNMKDSLKDLNNPRPPDHSTLPDKRTPAIKEIQQNEDLSGNDFSDVMMLLTDNHEVSGVYLAIGNSEQHTCYIQKQLESYRKCKTM